MNKLRAAKEAIELAKATLASCELKFIPNEASANDLANFIQTLSERLEKIGGND